MDFETEVSRVANRHSYWNTLQQSEYEYRFMELCWLMDWSYCDGENTDLRASIYNGFAAASGVGSHQNNIYNRSKLGCLNVSCELIQFISLCCQTNYKNDFKTMILSADIMCRGKRCTLKVWSTFILLTYGWLSSSLLYAEPSFESIIVLSWLLALNKIGFYFSVLE